MTASPFSDQSGQRRHLRHVLCGAITTVVPARDTPDPASRWCISCASLQPASEFVDVTEFPTGGPL